MLGKLQEIYLSELNKRGYDHSQFILQITIEKEATVKVAIDRKVKRHDKISCRILYTNLIQELPLSDDIEILRKTLSYLIDKEG